MTQMAVYSNSRLSCFEQCPQKFKFRYIDLIKPEIEETVESFLGTRVHEALKKLYTDLKFQKMLSFNELLDFYNSEWGRNWNDSILIVKKGYSQENFRKMGERFLEDYYEKYKPFEQPRTMLLESEGTVEIDNEKKHRIHIRIDRLSSPEEGVYYIHDYKTSNSLPTQEYLDRDRQLAIYAYGVKKMYPDAQRIKLVWHYLAFDKEMQSERTDLQLEHLRKEIVKLIQHIESCTYFPSKESALCNWCEYRPECPNFKHLFEIEQKSLNEYLNDDGVKLVNMYATISEEMKKNEEKLEMIRQALLSFAKREKINIVYGSDVKASISSYPRLSFPKKEDFNREEFFEIIRKIGLWDELATVDVYELAKMINNGELHEDLVKLLSKFIKKSETNVVRLRRK